MNIALIRRAIPKDALAEDFQSEGSWQNSHGTPSDALFTLILSLMLSGAKARSVGHLSAAIDCQSAGGSRDGFD